MFEKKEVYLTKEGLAQLKVELDELKLNKRPEIILAIKEARALGDLSENADYHAAREEQAKVESRIIELEKMIDNATIIEEHKVSDKASIGSIVTILYVADGEADEYKIVGSQEADPFNNKISNESPLGKAVIGRKVHEKVMVESPNPKDNYEIEILAIN